MATDQDIPIENLTPAPKPAADLPEREQLAQPARRAFIGRSGKLLIYTPPLIQLFIPTRALAASPSS